MTTPQTDRADILAYAIRDAATEAELNTLIMQIHLVAVAGSAQETRLITIAAAQGISIELSANADRAQFQNN